jgi:dienelactone hydrolase
MPLFYQNLSEKTEFVAVSILGVSPKEGYEEIGLMGESLGGLISVLAYDNQIKSKQWFYGRRLQKRKIQLLSKKKSSIKML